MPPIPCAHCGNNFMRQTLDPEAPKLCNNCTVREEKRNPTKVNTMDTVDILITCPKQVQINIEEYCINEGIDFSKYFLGLHYKKVGDEVSEQFLKPETELAKKETAEEHEKFLSKTSQNKGKKK